MIPMLSIRGAAAMLLATAGCLAATAPARAQAENKTVAVEAVPVVPAFTQWVNTVVVAPEPAPMATVTVLPWAVPAATAPVPYEPWPVILGAPELPLLGQGTAQAGRAWGAGFNYQGVNVRLLVLDASGRQVAVRALSAPPRAGDRFKIRVTTTFEAVSEVGLVLGEAFKSQRSGQLYPAAGQSVHMHAGETVDLPLDPGQFFVMGSNANERLLLTVRHPRAQNANRSQQPAYRIDAGNGSNYLQLVPHGSLAAIEQVVSAAH